MKIAFFGTSAFAVPLLTALAARPATELVAVVTQPDRPAGRGQKLAPTPVKVAALERGLAVLTPTALRAFAAELTALQPALAVVASYGRIVPQVLLDAVPLWLNVHPSLLPLYRGATPIPAAIRDGRATTAVTIIAMDAGMDTGDIVLQTEPLAIGPATTGAELHDRLAQRAAAALGAALDAFAAGTLQRTPQALWADRLGIAAAEIAATATRPFTKDDRKLRAFAAGHSARAVADLVRALAPKPGAVLEPDGFEQLTVLRAHPAGEPPGVAAAPPGAVARAGDGIYLKAGDGWVALDEIVPPGRRPMAAAAYLRGRP